MSCFFVGLHLRICRWGFICGKTLNGTAWVLAIAHYRGPYSQHRYFGFFRGRFGRLNLSCT